VATGAAALGVGGGLLAAEQQNKAQAQSGPLGKQTVPFYGAHQAGIETPVQA
jgi:dye decolorizing peroxidase